MRVYIPSASNACNTNSAIHGVNKLGTPRTTDKSATKKAKYIVQGSNQGKSCLREPTY